MLEIKHYNAGYRHIYGIDEAGRGPMAGPLVAAAVCLPLKRADDLPDLLKGVKDSKQMTLKQREAAYETIQQVALAWGIGAVYAHEMPTINNMTRVTHRAMERALTDATERSGITPDYLMIDYLMLPSFDLDRQQALKKGDTLSLSIAAASVLAKVWRDRYMIQMATKYPEYGFDSHKGYITRAHKAALREHGICEIHRLNYTPVIRAKSLFD
jgi:ribonuclease HII